MKAPLTFNSAELTDHTIIIFIFLKSMQETVQVKIKSSNLVKLFKRCQFSKSGLCDFLRSAFGGLGHGIHDNSESSLNIANRLWIFPFNISCNMWLKFQPIWRWSSGRHL